MNIHVYVYIYVCVCLCECVGVSMCVFYIRIRTYSLIYMSVRGNVERKKILYISYQYYYATFPRFQAYPYVGWMYVYSSRWTWYWINVLQSFALGSHVVTISNILTSHEQLRGLTFLEDLIQQPYHEFRIITANQLKIVCNLNVTILVEKKSTNFSWKKNQQTCHYLQFHACTILRSVMQTQTHIHIYIYIYIYIYECVSNIYIYMNVCQTHTHTHVHIYIYIYIYICFIK